MHKAIQQALREISQALQELHRDLLMLEARALQSDDGATVNPYDLLRASLHDPRFAWLRKFSMLIVHIDTIVDETPNLSGKEANQIASQVLELIEKPDAKVDQEFWDKYTSYLSNPEIIMKHSKVKALIGDLRPKM